MRQAPFGLSRHFIRLQMNFRLAWAPGEAVKQDPELEKHLSDTEFTSAAAELPPYRLEDQIGFKLRLANQRHLEIFARHIDGLTPTQFAVMAKLSDSGEVSQNRLGRMAGMDAATTKGVVDRLARRDLVRTRPSETDKRRLLVFLTPRGRALIEEAVTEARIVTEETLRPLTGTERTRLLELLGKLA